MEPRNQFRPPEREIQSLETFETGRRRAMHSIVVTINFLRIHRRWTNKKRVLQVIE